MKFQHLKIWRLGSLLPNVLQRAIFNTNWVWLGVIRKVYWGNNDLDKVVEPYLDTTRSGFFCELGANNGIAQSNTKHLELFHNWTGLLVEPELRNFQRLAVTRKKSTIKIQAAAVSFGFEGQKISLAYSNLMTTPLGVESDKDDPVAWAKLGEKILPAGESVHIIEAPARTLTEMLEAAGAPAQCQFLSLDVEGAELEVLRGLDFSKFTFEVLLVESNQIETIQEYLGNVGYTLEKRVSIHDYLFLHSSYASPIQAGATPCYPN